jgi:hypothetical protein
VASNGTTDSPLLVRLTLDAIDEFARATEHVPPPGRGGPIGRLSAASRVVAHGASTLDSWVNGYIGAEPRDAELDTWASAERAEGVPPPPFEEAQAALRRVSEGASARLAALERSRLAERTATRPSSFLEGQTVAHLLARTVAHLFVHAGELTVIASLLRRPDLGLPGRLPRSMGAPTEDAPDLGAPPLLVRLLLDAREAFVRVADTVPVPAQAGAFDRLNSGGWIVAHIAGQDDQYWSVNAQGLEPDAWLAAAHVRYGDEASKPPYPEARAALDSAFARSRPYLQALRPADFGRVLTPRTESRGEQTAQDLVVRQLAHVYALAGELLAIASLAGAEDLSLPEPMAHTLEAAS